MSDILIVFAGCLWIFVSTSDGEKSASAFVDVFVEDLIKPFGHIGICDIAEDHLIKLAQILKRRGNILIRLYVHDGNNIVILLCREKVFEPFRLAVLLFKDQHLIVMLKVYKGVVCVVRLDRVIGCFESEGQAVKSVSLEGVTENHVLRALRHINALVSDRDAVIKELDIDAAFIS